ncbi:MAG: FAD-dependent oxidoreductase [Candidatus Krumholzibacteriota bacterium]|nr:FAD-dependent oxidoreductase [Candidatus Krumholzibacteriota bacterium]
MNIDNRLKIHPILPIKDRKEISFTFNGKSLRALEGEVVTSALYANGIRIFGHHTRDGAPQGIFCVNGQCSQCMVIVNGRIVKGCMTVLEEGMRVESCEGSPVLPADDFPGEFTDCDEIETDVLVIGAGPAGINAAIELGNLGAKVLLIDDKNEPGGKLTLQTHPFFGSRDDCYAGTRGIDIADLMTRQLDSLDSVSVLTGTTAVGVFSDRKIGLYRGDEYFFVLPRIVLVACGAREKTLAFPGCDMPGVYGAGAFQTLLNRDLVKPAERLFIVGGGNVGLITGYHAVQAGIKVVGLVEALSRCGGYKVHLDKLRRLGVPVYTSHSILKAEGSDFLESITITAIDGEFRPVRGTEKKFDVDTLLIAVGLSPVDELRRKLEAFGIESYSCGDSEEIAEASAAIFSGKITGRKIARSLGYEIDIPDAWEKTQEVLRSRPGSTVPFEPEDPGSDIFPVLRCIEEIPCNPCVDSCPHSSILIPGDSIMGLPVFSGQCTGCMKCVTACPALAITLVRRGTASDGEGSRVVIPYEMLLDDLKEGRVVNTVDLEGNRVGEGKVLKVKRSPGDKKRWLVTLEVPDDDILRVAGFIDLEAETGVKGLPLEESVPDDTIICRCERITAGEIRAEIRAGVIDMNILKATIRTGMGACAGRTCTDLILNLYKNEGVDISRVTLPTDRPFVSEVPLSAFAGINKRGGNRD